jgi:hypothetical protein
MKIVGIPFSILGIVDEGYPGFVECEFRDAGGAVHRFIEKIPVVSTHDVWHETAFPVSDFLHCVEVSVAPDDTGRSISTVDTNRPWGIETPDGTIFRVLTSTMITIGDEQPDTAGN